MIGNVLLVCGHIFFVSDIVALTNRNLILEIRYLVDQVTINISSNFEFPVSRIV